MVLHPDLFGAENLYPTFAKLPHPRSTNCITQKVKQTKFLLRPFPPPLACIS